MDWMMLMVVGGFWIYSFFMYANARRIELECRFGNPNILVIFFIVLAVLSFINHISLLRFISFTLVILFGVFYSKVPSGFYKQGIIIQGRIYPFTKVNHFSYETNDRDDFVYINIGVGRRMYVLHIEEAYRKEVDVYRTLYLKGGLYVK